MDNYLEVVKTILMTVNSSVTVLMDELIRFYFINAVLHLILVFTVTSIVYRGFILGRKFLDTCEPGQLTTFYKSLFSILARATLVAGLIYGYMSSEETLKVVTAPHIYLGEKLSQMIKK